MTENTAAPACRLAPELRAYAAKLQAAGFTIYQHRPIGGIEREEEYFLYSRIVDGAELFGIVQRAQFHRLGEPLEHRMPIRPSREHGSMMYLEGPEHAATDPESVAYAELITRPTNHNRIVGTHANYHDPADLARRFDVLGPITDPEQES